MKRVYGLLQFRKRTLSLTSACNRLSFARKHDVTACTNGISRRTCSHSRPDVLFAYMVVLYLLDRNGHTLASPFEVEANSCVLWAGPRGLDLFRGHARLGSPGLAPRYSPFCLRLT